MSAVEAPPTQRRRGRPALAHDNTRVQAFVSNYASAFDLAQDWPTLDDVLTGATLLQPEGQCSTRALSKRYLFHVLQQCSMISTAAVAEVLGAARSLTTAVRYASIARVASKAIARCLATHPEWQHEVALLRASREEIDAPYLAEARALGIG